MHCVTELIESRVSLESVHDHEYQPGDCSQRTDTLSVKIWDFTVSYCIRGKADMQR